MIRVSVKAIVTYTLDLPVDSFNDICEDKMTIEESDDFIKRFINSNHVMGKIECVDSVRQIGIVKDCSTCANNVEYPPPHTCDVCTSLDEEKYCMWKPKDTTKF